jgi:hypothetical protein
MNKKPDFERLSSEQKAQIQTMFFGPYLPEWKINGVVDNSDATIGKRLGISAYMISNYTEKICEEHFKKVIDKINKGDST